MTITIIIVSMAFYWLMLETNWLRVRLAYGRKLVGDIIIQNLMPIVVVGAIIMGVLKQFVGVKRKPNLRQRLHLALRRILRRAMFNKIMVSLKV